VLDSVSSKHTKRAYDTAISEFLDWYRAELRPPFSKAVVQAHKAYLEERGLSPASINIRLSALRKLATEAADNGLMAPELAAGIVRVKGVKQQGVRLGNWLTVRQAEKLINAPDLATLKGKRDRALLAVLLGCGLRRSEAVALNVEHVQQREGRWVIVDLVGKHGRVRSVPMPSWAKVAMDLWTEAAGITQDRVFRPINKGGRLSGQSLTDKVVAHVIRSYAAPLGLEVAAAAGRMPSGETQSTRIRPKLRIQGQDSHDRLSWLRVVLPGTGFGVGTRYGNSYLRMSVI